MEEKRVVKPLRSLTIKTEEEEVDRFNQMKEELGLATSGQMLTEMLDRIEQPQRIADHTKELQAEVEHLKQLLAAEEAAHAETKNALSALQSEGEQAKTSFEQRLQELQAEANHNAEVAGAQQMAYQKQLDDLRLGDNQRVVSFTADNLKVLDFVAARESRRRKQQWSISHVINFFIYARFVKGWLNGDLESVGDSDLRKLGVGLKTKAKEAVEI